MNIDNYKKIRKVLWIIFFANILVALLKIVIGSLIKSSSITADGFHSLSDGSSNIVGLIGIGLASKPIDKDHPYGHKKFEVLSGLFIAVMLVFMGGKIIINGIVGFTAPKALSITPESLITILITLFINILVSKYEYSIGKKLNSYILISDSLHTKSDIFVSLGVLTTLIGIKLGLPPIVDSIASLVVAGFILHAAYEIFISTSGILVDKAILDDEFIKNAISDFSEIKDIHNIRSRGSENNIYIDMHVMLDPKYSVEDSHVLLHKIENKIREKTNNNTEVIIHVEPYYENILNRE
ncbi:cation diffusion facilitator family transporter [uncultured Clostridium sp.]|uniref:cation diffusion facilitator family transporter n=1 Tax=uncultured Clostridium sp. TaxID=59620 RepID=UPI00321746D7